MKLAREDFDTWAAARSMRAIPKRLQLAFPELAVLFPLLVVGFVRGQAWRRVVDDHTAPMSADRVARLADELADLFAMGCTDEQFDVLCFALGLDRALAGSEYGTLYRFVAELEERVSSERLARLARPAV